MWNLKRNTKPMYIIAGLGNPGSKYENTRHNAGFMAIDRLAESKGVDIIKNKFNSLTAQCEIGGEKVLLMKPLTYMNNSGEAIEEARAFFKIPEENVIVISDDITQKPGKLRIRRKGSAGGHNGLKSIIQCVGTDEFPRIRVGVGEKPHPDADLISHVLGRFSEEEMKELTVALDNAAKAAELIVAGDIAEAMNRYN